MQAVPETAVVLALFNLDGGEIIPILALVLILLLAQEMFLSWAVDWGRRIFKFRDAIRRLIDSIDGEAREAGRSVGGIYGKRATQALTPDNQVAELYDPAVFQAKLRPRKRRRGLRNLFMRFWEWISQFLQGIR